MVRTMLRVERVTKRFGGLVAVDGLSFDVNEREVLGIIGPNGSGKTTMLNMMSGAFKPSEGFISLSDRQISGKAAQTIARAGVGRTFQLVRLLPGLTVLENVVAGAVFGHRRQWGQSAKMVALRMMERVSLNISPNAPMSLRVTLAATTTRAPTPSASPATVQRFDGVDRVLASARAAR